MRHRRALLIGAEAFGLSGVVQDLDLMEGLLKPRGFVIERCAGQSATYEGIVSALDGFVAATDPNDTVVVYYSGHGGRQLRPDWAERRSRGESAYVSYLVPIDLEESTDECFRGVLSVELSAKQRQLTARTRNVTTILDCCFSGAMSREPLLQARALARAVPMNPMLDREAAIGGERVFANPDAVRLVATETDRVAWEAAGPDGRRCGLFTGTLVAVLEDLAERPVSWRQVIFRARQVLEYRALRQRPTVEGPAIRRPFSLDEGPAHGAFPVTHREGGLVVEAGRLLGLHEGDRVRLGAPDTAGAAGQDATVSAFSGLDAVLKVSSLPPGEPLVATVVASARRHAIHVDASGSLGRDVRRLVASSPRLTLVDTPVEAFLDVAIGNHIEIRNAGGQTLYTTSHVSAGHVHDVLESLVHADRLRALADAPDSEPLALNVLHCTGDVTIGVPTATAFHPGDRLAVQIANLSPSRLYVWLFDIGVSGRVTLLTNDQPDGRPLPPAGVPGDVHTVGGSQGMELSWPVDAPPSGPRMESLLAVAANRSLDLSVLETSNTAAFSNTRDLLAPDGLPAGYYAIRFDFALHALPRQQPSGERSDPV